jgi:hypothetical protein
MRFVKPFIKIYFLLSILLVLAITLSLVVYQWGDQITFFQNIGVTKEVLTMPRNILGGEMSIISFMLRIWVFNLGFSGFMAVTTFAIEEEMGFSSKTAMYALIINVGFALLLIFLLRKLLGKKPMTFGVM